ncbi:MAG TPA: PASTA domain-containing protein [Candidatus Polarisedimenticolaceae bacterium]
MSEPKPAARRGALRLAARAVALAALAAACGVAGFWVALQFGPDVEVVAVPDLAGVSVEDAQRLAREAGLELEVVEERNDPDADPGTVAEQDPAAGAEVARGRRVRVVRSLGSERLVVPDLVGQPAREVEIRLRQLGLEPGVESHAFRRAAPVGAVLAQVPPAGGPASSGTRVHRLVSDGPVPVRWVMPDLSGRRLDDVETWLRWSGLRRGALRRVDGSGRDSGTIVGQLPAAGAPVSARGVVELTLAR